MPFSQKYYVLVQNTNKMCKVGVNCVPLILVLVMDLDRVVFSLPNYFLSL